MSSKPLRQAGQHAQSQHIDLEDAEVVQIVLVPFHHRAVLHGRILDGHQLLQRPAGHDEAADMLGEMAGKADELGGELEGLAQPRRLGIEAELLHPRRLQPAAAPAPDGAGQCGDGIGGEPHGLADLAQRRAAAVADHRGGEAGALAAVFPVDILDHLLAPLMLEIDVDVRRLACARR